MFLVEVQCKVVIFCPLLGKGPITVLQKFRCMTLNFELSVMFVMAGALLHKIYVMTPKIIPSEVLHVRANPSIT